MNKSERIEEFILETKLIPPLLIDNELIIRSRLISIFEKNLGKKLILVIANAGYGKTTFLLQALRGLKLPFIWLQLDETDKDLIVFLRYLIIGIKRHYPNFGERTLNVLKELSGRTINIEILVGTFINELTEFIKDNLWLAIDDLQNVCDSAEINQGLEYLITHLPPKIKIILSSRSYPPFPLENFFAKNEVLEFNDEDLKFDHDEIRKLYEKIRGFSPKNSEIERLMWDSEGWITYLQFLIRISQHSEKATFARKHLTDRFYLYFDREVFQKIEPDIKNFLLGTSILDSLTPDVCNYLLDITNAYEILENLVKRHLFISVSPTAQPIYRYHSLFRNFLLKKLEERKIFSKYQRRAGEYYLKRGDCSRAIAHFIRGGDYLKASSLVEEFGEKLFERGKIRFLSDCIERIPHDTIKGKPRALRLLGRISHFDCDFYRAQDYFLKSMRVASKRGNYEEYFLALADHLTLKFKLGEINSPLRKIKSIFRLKKLRKRYLKIRFLNILGGILVYRGQFKRAIETLKQAINLSRRVKDNHYIAICLHNFAVANIISGDFSTATRNLEYLRDRLSSEITPLLISVLNNLGVSLISVGELARAESVFKEALKFSQLLNDKGTEVQCFSNLASVNMYRGDLDDAEQFLSGAEKIAKSTGNNQLLAGILGDRAEVALRRGDFFKAKELITESLKCSKYPLHNASFLLILAIAELSLRNAGSARKILAKVRPVLKDSKQRMMTWNLLSAWLHIMENNRRSAYKSLSRAIQIAEENGYEYHFIDQIKYSPELIKFVKSMEVHSSYLRSALSKVPCRKIFDTLVEPEEENFDIIIRLFGIPEIKIDGELLKRPWRTKKVEELFYFLVVHRNEFLTRDGVTGEFWPDHNPKIARQLFHNFLYWIRRTIRKNIIIFERGYYKISSDLKFWVDIEEFKRLINLGQGLINDGNHIGGLVELEKALSLYRGGFMDSFYGEWSQKLRLEFEALYLDLLENLAKGYYKMQNHQKAVIFCRELISADPYNEEAYRLLMRCYAKLNNLGGVKKTYEELRDVLKRDLKTDPHPLTRELLNSLIRERSS